MDNTFEELGYWGGSVNVTASANSGTGARTGNITIKTSSGISRQVTCVQSGPYTYSYTLNLSITCYNTTSVEESVTIAESGFRNGPSLVGYYGGPLYGGLVSDNGQYSKVLKGIYTFTDYEKSSLSFNILDINIEHDFSRVQDASCSMYIGGTSLGSPQNADQISNSDYSVTATWNTKFQMYASTDYYINGYWEIWLE